MLVNIVICILAYLVGNILGGKVCQKIFKEDIAKKGSGNIGARNAGRVLGFKAFLLVSIIDVFKGFLVVIVLKLMNFNILIITIAILFVILGHIKPILNKFDGGKGVATFLGTMLALSPNLLFVLILGVFLISFITRSTTIGFYSSLPVLIYVYYLDFKSIYGTLIFIIIIMLLFIVSADSIENSFNKYFEPKKRKIVNK